MKLPALWIALSFAAGIAAEKLVPASTAAWMAIAVVMLFAGFALYFAKKTAIAGVIVLFCWMAVGGLAAQSQSQNVAPNDVARLIASRKIETSEALRWRGRLRIDPERLPWGTRYTLDLTEVEISGKTISVSGGMRLTSYYDSGNAPPPTLRAGDLVEALARAQPPRNYMNPGAFDERAFLSRENIELLGSLRNNLLIRKIAAPPPTISQRLARVRGDLLARLDAMFARQGQREAVLRAMLLGDRNFVDSDVAANFQKTSAFHVLVVAGLHVGALALFVFWLGRLLRLPMIATTLIALVVLAGYVGVVQDRPPILRAALMAGIFLCARMLFRRVALVNTVALAALILLLARPLEIFDPSFQLSFVAAGVIAGIAVPWIDLTSGAYRGALAHLSDAGRDRLFAPRATQFRLDLRALSAWLAPKLPKRLASHAATFFTLPVRAGLRVWEIFLLSFCIQLGMVPLLALDFHRVSLAGPIGNVPAVLLTTLIVPLGFLALGASYIWMGIAALLAKIVSLLAGALLASVDWFSRLPRVSWRIPGPPDWLLVAFFAALSALAVQSWMEAEAKRENPRAFGAEVKHKYGQWTAFCVVFSLTILISTYPFAPSLPRGDMAATVIDVGQGDSIFLSFPDGRTMLVDGGGAAGAETIGGYHAGTDVGEQVVSPFLWSRGVKKLDVVLLTHAHHDHIDGLRAVLQNFRVGQLWVGRDEDSLAYRALLAEARARHVRIVHQMQGDDFEWGRVRGRFLWPADPSEAPAAANDDSVVLRLSDGKIHYLLTGDIESAVEKTLVEEHEPLAANFLKVPHHGSKTSSTEDFLDDVQPQVAAASVGEDNPFGQPNPGVVERYQTDHVELLMTERDGAVTALTDGKTLFVRTFAGSERR